MYDPCRLPMLGARMMAPVLGHKTKFRIVKNKRHKPVYEGGCFAGVSELGVRDDPQPRLASFQAAKLNLHRDSTFSGTLDVRACNGDVLLIGLAQLFKIRRKKLREKLTSA